MLKDIISAGKDRIKLDNLPRGTPSLPSVQIRSEGFFGSPNPLDKAHLNRLLDIRYMGIESEYALTCQAVLGVSGQRIVSTAAESMEERTDELPQGSLSKELSDKICGFNAQILAESHVTLMHNFAQSAVNHIRRADR